MTNSNGIGILHITIQRSQPLPFFKYCCRVYCPNAIISNLLSSLTVVPCVLGIGRDIIRRVWPRLARPKARRWQRKRAKMQ